MKSDVVTRPRSNNQEAPGRSSTIERPRRVQHLKSLVPPSIVELGSNRVVLSWRATVGQCSIRTAISECSTDSQEWVNLEEDSTRCNTGTKNHATRRGVHGGKATTVEVFDIDHVELQTCSGCQRCIHGDGDIEEDGEEAHYSRCELGCWRPVYDGPDSRCQVNLERRNAIHYFRLLVRATLPPQAKRGYMRSTLAEILGKGTDSRQVSKLRGNNSGSGKFEVASSPDWSSPRRRPRSQTKQHQPGLAIANCSASRENSPLSTYGFHDEDGTDFSRNARGEKKGGAAATANKPRSELVASATTDRVQWFASTSVFVDSRPPPVTIHGIGTALVLTWPSYTGLSGAEKVSYILEQWSYTAKAPTLPASGEAEGNGGKGKSYKQAAYDLASRKGQRRRQYNLTPPSGAEVKDVFSVGTRCWFMPSGLKTGKNYWYRLGLIHEGGKSVGGPWVSHLTCVSPPRCIHVGPRDLALSFPRAIGNASCCTLKSGGRRDTARRQACADSSVYKDSRAGQNSAIVASSTARLALGKSETEVGGDMAERMDGDDEQFPGRGGATNHRDEIQCDQESDTPVVCYTLEGSTKGSGWNFLYRGPAPEVKIEGLHPSTLVRFRVGIDVDITELRHRSLSSLTSLELEAQSINATAKAVTCSTNGTTSLCSPPSPKETLGNQRCAPPSKSIVVRPALRLCSAAMNHTSQENSLGKGTTIPAEDLFQRRSRPWSPTTSPVMSKMKREGFAIHDAATMVGGGFYLERPLLSWGRLQGHRGGAVWECGAARGKRQLCREYSGVGEFCTASMPTRFASFVVDGVPQVKLWWVQPNADPGAAAHIVRTVPASVPPSSSSGTPLVDHHRKNHHEQAINSDLPSCPGEGRPSTPAAMRVRQPKLGTGGKVECADAPSPFQQEQQCPFFTLDFVEPSADGEKATMQRVYSGQDLWTDLWRPFSVGSFSSSVSCVRHPLMPPEASTAYAVRLSMSTGAAQPNSAVEGLVITAPSAPALEPVTRAGEEAQKILPPAEERTGAVTLKATWNADIDTTFLPAGVELPPFSIGLEMSHAWESGSPALGRGGTTMQAAPRVGCGQQRPPVSPQTRVSADKTPSPDHIRSTGSAQGILVRQDAGLGLCWTLGSSSWCKPRKSEEEFRVIWTGGGPRVEGGVIEALTPPLSPGMRFAFRIRVECRFGVAVSAATVYQTAPVVPMTPKGLRAFLVAHESRVGHISKCLQLSWDSFHPDHGKNVVTFFTVQARRPRTPSGDQLPRDAYNPEAPPVLGQSWRDICFSPEIGCLDPATLGVTHIVADYRVRAEGPGGKGSWCEPLSVDIRVPSDENDDGTILDETPSKISGGGDGRHISGDYGSSTCAGKEDRDKGQPSSQQQPMGFLRPGTRVRNPLTGEARRLWTKQRPPTLSLPQTAVAAVVQPGAVVTARTVKEMESSAKRARSSVQLSWGALTSPRPSGECPVTPRTSVSAVAIPRVGEAGKSTDGATDRGGSLDGDNGPRHLRDSYPVNTPEVPGYPPVGRVKAVAAVPHDLALVLREELDVSCRLGCDAAGHQREGGVADEAGRHGSVSDKEDVDSSAVPGATRGSLECPVVAWVAPPSLLDPQSDGERNYDKIHRHQRTRRRCARQQRKTAANEQGATTSIEVRGQEFCGTVASQQYHHPRHAGVPCKSSVQSIGDSNPRRTGSNERRRWPSTRR